MVVGATKMPSSSTMILLSLAAASASASGEPAGWRLVGTSRRPADKVSSPRVPRKAFCDTVNGCVKRTSMPSTWPRLSLGNVTLTGTMLWPLLCVMMEVTSFNSVYEFFAPDGVYSNTVPVTRTRSPGCTAATVLPVYTKMPSEVVGSPSPAGSWIKKPVPTFSVTTPSVVCTELAYGLLAPGPWICGIVWVTAARPCTATLTWQVAVCCWSLLNLTTTG